MNEFSFFDLKDKRMCRLLCNEIDSVGHSEEFNCCHLTDLLGKDYYCEYSQLVAQLTPLSENLEPELMDVVIELAEQCGNQSISKS